MVRCPECASPKMKYDSRSSRYVCQRCGLALSRGELDRSWDEQRSAYRRENQEDARAQRRRDYLDWWLSSKEKEKPKRKR